MNPVLQKDILGLLRLTRVAVIQVLFVAALALVVLGTWPQGGVVGGTVEIARSSGIRASDSLMLWLMLGQLVLLTLLVPGIAAVAITSEREGDTLEMLYASRLTAVQIIVGKIGLAVAYPILLLVAGVPFVALLAWRGELRVDDLMASYGVIAIAAIYLTLLSLGISAVCRQGTTALVIAYVVVLITCGGVLVPGAIMLEGTQGSLAPVLHYVRGISPVAAVLSILKPRMGDFGGIERHTMPLYKVFIPLATALSLGALTVIAMRLRKAPATLEGFGAPRSGTKEKRAWDRRIMFLIDPSAKRPPLGRGNPMLGKERRTSNLRSATWMIRIFYGSLFLSLALAVMAMYGGTEHADLMRYVAQVLISLQIALITLVVPSLSTGLVSSELENGTFELLRLTRLSGGQVFWGKLLPSLPPAILPMLALVPAYAALAFIDRAYIPNLLQILPVVLLAVVMMAIMGLTCSAWSRNTARATVVAYLIASSIVVIPMLVWWASDMQVISILAARWVVCLSPMVMAMNLLPDSNPAIAQLGNIHLMTTAGICVVMLLLARYRLNSLLRHG